jgi:hypothetical protein
VDGEDHGAGGIADSGIRVGAGIVEELGDMCECLSSCVCLSSCWGTQGDKHGAVNRTGIVQERSDDLLEAFNLLGR